MPTFYGKSEKFELFEDLYQTILKNQNQQTEDNRIKYLHSLIKGNALQVFKNVSNPTREKMGDVLAVFRRKNVKSQSMAAAKRRIRKFIFNP